MPTIRELTLIKVKNLFTITYNLFTDNVRLKYYLETP